MKIGITAYGCDSGRSGISRYLKSLLKRLPKIAGDTEFELIGSPEDCDIFLEPDSTVSRFSQQNVSEGIFGNVLWHWNKLPKLVEERGYDLLFLPAGNRRLVWRSTVPVAATVHDMSWLHVRGKYDPLRTAYLKHVLPRQIRNLDLVLTVSESSKNDILKSTGIDPERIVVTYLGFEPIHSCFDMKEEEKARVRSKFGITRPYLFYLSRIEHPGKNHVRLIKAFEILNEQLGYELDLVLSGNDFTGAEHVHHAARESRYSDRIHLTGRINDTDIAPLLHGAELCVFPSLFEGFGLPVLEAMAAGVPVACSAIPSHLEIAGMSVGKMSEKPQNKAPILFDPYKPDDIVRAMTRILSHPEERQKLIDQQIERARHFSWDATARQTWNAFERAIAMKSAPAKAKRRSNTSSGFFQSSILATDSATPLSMNDIEEVIAEGVSYQSGTNKRESGKYTYEKEMMVSGSRKTDIATVDVTETEPTCDVEQPVTPLPDRTKVRVTSASTTAATLDSPSTIGRTTRRGLKSVKGLFDLVLISVFVLLLMPVLFVLIAALSVLRLIRRQKVSTPEKYNILGITFDNLTAGEAIDRIIEHIKTGQIMWQISFVNTACLNISSNKPKHGRKMGQKGELVDGYSDNMIFSQKNADYRDVLLHSDLVLGDGIGVRLGGYVNGSKVRDNVNGTDLFPQLCSRLEEEHSAGMPEGRIFLLGARPNVVHQCVARLLAEYPALDIAGWKDGYFRQEETPAVLQEIKESKADILLVAMGVPQQELWITQHAAKAGVKVAMGVGGLFDFYSGRIARAPYLIRALGFEWVFRFIQEPRRMFKRYVLGNVVYIWRIIRYGENSPRGTVPCTEMSEENRQSQPPLGAE